MDLHIHSCLSPCADDTMTPRAIVESATAAGLDWIGVADHNAADNTRAVRAAGSRVGLAVAAALEVTTREEVHLLAVFDDPEAALRLGEIVGERLVGLNDERAFGRQLMVEEDGRIRGVHPRLLIGATTLSLPEMVARIRSLGGLVIASHVDRPSYSIVSQLGFVPAGVELDAVEVSPREAAQAAIWGERLGLPAVCFSDAHTPQDIGRVATRMLLEAPAVEELRKALRGADGRRVLAS